MKLLSLALMNFRQSLRQFAALIFSLSFAIMMVFSFSSMADQNAFGDPSSLSADRIALLSDIVRVILAFFTVLLIWYAMNAFLRERKHEFGTYLFMGFTPARLARLYGLEMVLCAVFSIACGIGGGMLLNRLFVMIIAKLAGLQIAAQSSISLEALKQTLLLFGAVWVILIAVSMIRIQNSSILSLMNASRKEEGSSRPVWLLWIEAILGTGLLITGFSMVSIDSENIFGILMNVVLLVTFGVYFLFAGVVPLSVRFLLSRKTFLYRGVRPIWLSNLRFRLEQNYRTYAAVSILILSAMTALLAGMAFHNRVEGIEQYELQYNYQVLSYDPSLMDTLQSAISQNNTPVIANQIEIRQASDDSQTNADAFVSESQMKALAAASDLEWDFPALQPDQTIDFSHTNELMSLVTLQKNMVSDGQGEVSIIEQSTKPYLGKIQGMLDLYVLNDSRFASLPDPKPLYIYSFAIEDPDNFEASRQALSETPGVEGVVAIGSADGELDWLKTLFAFALFIFLDLTLCAVVMLMIKITGDAASDRESCAILSKTGIDASWLAQSVRHECAVPYLLTFLVSAGGGWFAWKTIEKTVDSVSIWTYWSALGVIAVILIVFYALTCLLYLRQAGIRDEKNV